MRHSLVRKHHITHKHSGLGCVVLGGLVFAFTGCGTSSTDNITRSAESSQSASQAWWAADVPYRIPDDGRGVQWYRNRVADAAGIIDAAARQRGWDDHLSTYWDQGVEIFVSQTALWQRILELHGLSADQPLPTESLAAGLEKSVLLAITPDTYTEVQPQYAHEEGAYIRLLAHEMAHRLHIAILAGDEDAMGPTWFFEGFAVVVSGDLENLETATPESVWEFTRARGKGSYAKYGAALRYLDTHCVPMQEMVAYASDVDFETWLSGQCATSDLERAEH